MKSLSEFSEEAKLRAKRRKSKWNYALFTIKWPFAFIWCVGWVKIVLWIPHKGALTFYEAAQHDGLMLLIVLPLLFLSLILGMITANLLFFLIPNARKTFEFESGNYQICNFVNAQKPLLKIAGITALVAVPTALTASWNIPF